MEKTYIEYLLGGRTFLDTEVKAWTGPWDIGQRPASAIGYRLFNRTELTTPSGDVLKGERRYAERTTYFGTELTLEQVKQRGRPEDSTLIWNMEANEYARVVETMHKQVYPLNEHDQVVEG